MREKGDRNRQVTSVDASGELNLLVKFFALGNAAGNTGDPVLIVAISEMPEGEFFVLWVVGVTNSTMLGTGGWLYCCKTKCGTPSMWRHWYKHVCIATLSKVQCGEDEYGVPRRKVLATDGEACIMHEASDEEVMEEFHENDIDYLKLPPSTSNTWQAWDTGDVFRSVKAGIRKCVKDNVYTEDDVLRKSLASYFMQFKAEFPKVNITAKYMEKIVYSIMLIVYNLKQFLLSHHVKISFIRAGM